MGSQDGIEFSHGPKKIVNSTKGKIFLLHRVLLDLHACITKIIKVSGAFRFRCPILHLTT
jgi:hypothetical protein